MICDKIVEDDEFGHLYVRTNARARQFTFRAAKDGSAKCGILITVPTWYVLRDVLNSVENMRPKLRKLIKDYVYDEEKGEACPASMPKIDWNFRIETDCMRISLVKGNKKGFYLHNSPATLAKNENGEDVVSQPAEMQIVCPEDTDFDADGRQEWLEKAIIEGLRSHAKMQLVPRLLAYAKRYDIRLKEVKINTSKSHWGSCSRHKTRALFKTETSFNINLSVFTLLLPMELQKLVLLHELMHTRHMDHSEAFHRDLDIWLNGREKVLEAELKKYRTTIFGTKQDNKN